LEDYLSVHLTEETEIRPPDCEESENEKDPVDRRYFRGSAGSIEREPCKGDAHVAHQPRALPGNLELESRLAALQKRLKIEQSN